MKISKKQQELMALTSLPVPTHANHLVLQANKIAKKIQDTSGQTLLELSKSAGPLGLLEKMLVDTLNSVLIPYSRTWRVKVTTQGHLLFQLHPLVHGTKGKESGLSDIKQYPTPTVGCEEGGEQSNRVELTPNGSFILRKKNKPDSTFGAKLSDAMLFLEKQKMYPTPTTQEIEHPDMKLTKNNRRMTNDGKNSHSLNLADTVRMYPTPKARDYKDTGKNTDYKKLSEKGKLTGRVMMQHQYPTPTNSEHKYRLKGNSQASKCLEAQARRAGGKLNPNFVEFLMGFPMNWTKVELEESKD